MIVGRRGGKSFIVSLIAIYLAIFRDYRPHLSPGERATMIIAAAALSRAFARQVLKFFPAHYLDLVPAVGCADDPLMPKSA